VSEEWRDAALCQQADPEIFYPPTAEDAAAAKRVCRNCTVQQECAEFALTRDDRYGVWGGLTPRERRKLAPAAGAS
jgi:WhiB family redox-sensing transcriptional regulator